MDSEGNLVGFMNLPRLDGSVETVFSEEECLTIAKKFFATMVEDIDEYQVVTQYQKYTKVYYFIFVKYVDSFPTADQARVGVLADLGCVYSYKATMIGRMDVNAKVNVDRSKADEAVMKKLDKILSTAREKYDEVTCEKLSYTLTRNENQYILVCDAEIKYTEITEDSRLEMSEMIKFVIT
jgi:hypothetical protein